MGPGLSTFCGLKAYFQGAGSLSSISPQSCNFVAELPSSWVQCQTLRIPLYFKHTLVQIATQTFWFTSSRCHVVQT